MIHFSAFARVSLLAMAWSVVVAAANPPGSILIDHPPGRRDPFEPTTSDASERRSSHPLERFALRELRLVAIVDGIVPRRALIEDPNGLGFIITPGSVIGAERGEVVSIEDGMVVLNAPADTNGDRQVLTLRGGTSKQEQP
jgi:hypothetical protein